MALSEIRQIFTIFTPPLLSNFLTFFLKKKKKKKTCDSFFWISYSLRCNFMLISESRNRNFEKLIIIWIVGLSKSYFFLSITEERLSFLYFKCDFSQSKPNIYMRAYSYKNVYPLPIRMNDLFLPFSSNDVACIGLKKIDQIGQLHTSLILYLA